MNFVLGLAEVVGREGFTTKTATSLKEARNEIAKAAPDVLLIDLHLPDGSGLDLVKDFEENAGTEIVLITGHGTIETAVEAMRHGASDHLVKPVDFARVRMVLANVSRTRELKQQIGSLRGELRKLGRFGPLIGSSAQMQKVYDLVAKVAPTEATILVLGETGTGKELCARALHTHGPRAARPFSQTLSPSDLSINNFGTDEALQFAQEIGGSLLITVNVATGTPEDVAEVEESFTGAFLRHVLPKREVAAA